jgi:hypothetical protein
MEGFDGAVGARLEKAGIEFLDGERPGVRMGK